MYTSSKFHSSGKSGFIFCLCTLWHIEVGMWLLMCESVRLSIVATECTGLTWKDLFVEMNFDHVHAHFAAISMNTYAGV